MTYLEPALPVLLLLGGLALIRAWRRGASGRDLLPVGFALLGVALMGSNWVAWALSRPLEGAYSRSAFPAESADAIVVLGGSADAPTASQPYATVSLDTYRRLRHGVWLVRNWKAVPILVSGGMAAEGQPPLAVSMRQFLESAGVAPSEIWTEERSGSTYENARFSAEVLRAHGVSRVVLVVEALGMPRAAAAFEKAGIGVVPAPIRFATLDGGLTDVVPGWRPMVRTGEVVHEVLGLLWYRLRGRI